MFFAGATTEAAITKKWGEALGKVLIPPLVIALHGNLGAGKTLLTQGIAAGLGITQPVTSPTFVLVNEYPLPADRYLIHVDSYRLGDTPAVATAAAWAMGLDELIARPDAIVVIEWAPLVADLLPTDHLQIRLDHQPTDPALRQLRCTAFGPVSEGILQQWQQAIGA